MRWSMRFPKKSTTALWRAICFSAVNPEFIMKIHECAIGAFSRAQSIPFCAEGWHINMPRIRLVPSLCILSLSTNILLTAYCNCVPRRRHRCRGMGCEFRSLHEQNQQHWSSDVPTDPERKTIGLGSRFKGDASLEPTWSAALNRSSCSTSTCSRAGCGRSLNPKVGAFPRHYK